MTLPSATAFELPPSPTPSAEEMRAYAANRNNKWFNHKQPEKREKAKGATTAPRVIMRLPDMPRRLDQHDSHVVAYYEWMGNEPLGFIKLKCREMGVSFSEITAKSRFRRIVKPRQSVICEVKKKFPALSLNQIGRLFGGFDHTTIRHALIVGGLDGAFPKRTADSERATIYRLLLVDKSYGEIAEAVGFSKPAVASVIRRNGWCGKSEHQRISDYRDEVKRMFDDGATFAHISRTLGFAAKNIGSYVKRQGWVRRPISPPSTTA